MSSCEHKRQCVITNKISSIIGLSLYVTNMAKIRETARKTTAFRVGQNNRAAVIQAYENYKADPTHTLIEHVEEVFARWTT